MNYGHLSYVKPCSLGIHRVSLKLREAAEQSRAALDRSPLISTHLADIHRERGGQERERERERDPRKRRIEERELEMERRER